MNEEEARIAVCEMVAAPIVERLSAFVAAVRSENSQQNLIAASTTASIWHRHVLDSLQLLALSTSGGNWIDVGSGGGFPGMVIAIAADGRFPVHLVEPRRRRAEFLRQLVGELGLAQTHVHCERVEMTMGLTAATISARAVSSVEKLLIAARHCATAQTRWLLPRGQIEPNELAALQQHWGGMFHVEHSITEPTSRILVITGVSAA